MSEYSHNHVVGRFWAVLLVLVGFSPGLATTQGETEKSNAAPPEELVFASPVGTVTFPHALHVTDLGAACTDCHHPAAAPALKTPHPQWLPKAGHQCLACHGKKETNTAEHYACTDCHSQPLPASHGVVSSRKVAIHLACARCHEFGTAQDANKACGNCHAGAKVPW
ncbi:MAG: cytochrome c3 family protein [Thermoanaerobaculum sp.]